MYTNILMPTDGSELAGKAIRHGIALAKLIGNRSEREWVKGLFAFQKWTTKTSRNGPTPAKSRTQRQAEKILRGRGPRREGSEPRRVPPLERTSSLLT